MKNIYSLILFSAWMLFKYFLLPFGIAGLPIILYDMVASAGDISILIKEHDDYVGFFLFRSMLLVVLYLIFKIGKEEWKNDWEYKDGIGLGKFLLIALGVYVLGVILILLQLLFNWMITGTNPF